MSGVDEFEYRRPVNSQPDSTPAMSRSGADDMGSGVPDFASLLSAAEWESDGIVTAAAGTADAAATASTSRVIAVSLACSSACRASSK